MKVTPLAPPGLPTVLPANFKSYGEWYTLRLNGRVLPGAWRVTGGRVHLKCDKKNKGGVSGGNPVLSGIDPQQFELDGEQFNDGERQALADIFADLMPQPGQPQNQGPIWLDHPSLASFGFAIFVVILGCTPFEQTGPCTSKVKVTTQHWLPATKSSPSATFQPNNGYRAANARARQAAILRQKENGQVNAAGNQSIVPPASQPGAAAPPAQIFPSGS